MFLTALRHEISLINLRFKLCVDVIRFISDFRGGYECESDLVGCVFFAKLNPDDGLYI